MIHFICEMRKHSMHTITRFAAKPQFVVKTQLFDRFFLLMKMGKLGGCTVFKYHENLNISNAGYNKFFNHRLKSLRKQFVTF